MTRNEISLWILRNNGALAQPLWGEPTFSLIAGCLPNMRNISYGANVVTPQHSFGAVCDSLSLSLVKDSPLKTLTKRTINEGNHKSLPFDKPAGSTGVERCNLWRTMNLGLSLKCHLGRCALSAYLHKHDVPFFMSLKLEAWKHSLPFLH